MSFTASLYEAVSCAKRALFDDSAIKLAQVFAIAVAALCCEGGPAGIWTIGGVGCGVGAGVGSGVGAGVGSGVGTGVGSGVGAGVGAGVGSGSVVLLLLLQPLILANDTKINKIKIVANLIDLFVFILSSQANGVVLTISAVQHEICKVSELLHKASIS